MTGMGMTAASRQAAGRFIRRRNHAAGATSTLRKVAREYRIAAGLRDFPQQPLTRTVASGRKQYLHPTKGWRFV